MKTLDNVAELNRVNEAISSGSVTQFVTFTLAEEEYALEVLKVQEIIGYQGMTKVPKVPAFVKGVINLRGSVVPVVDLRIKLGMAEKEHDKSTVILILEVQGRVLGAIVDAVSDVIDLTSDEIQPTPDFSSGVMVDAIQGMGRKDGRLVIILNIDHVLGSDDLAQLNVA